MLKALVYFVLIVIFFANVSGHCEDENEKIVSVSSGTSFGFCVGYCQQSIRITFNKRELLVFKEANGEQPQYPPIQKCFSFAILQWRKLLNRIDLEIFRNLDETIGCPDCADGGAEWIEINWGTSNKRITFEFGQSIESIQPLIDELRRLRKKYIDQLST